MLSTDTTWPNYIEDRSALRPTVLNLEAENLWPDMKHCSRILPPRHPSRFKMTRAQTRENSSFLEHSRIFIFQNFSTYVVRSLEAGLVKTDDKCLLYVTIPNMHTMWKQIFTQYIYALVPNLIEHYVLLQGISEVVSEFALLTWHRQVKKPNASAPWGWPRLPCVMLSGMAKPFFSLSTNINCVHKRHRFLPLNAYCLKTAPVQRLVLLMS